MNILSTSSLTIVYLSVSSKGEAASPKKGDSMGKQEKDNNISIKYKTNA